MQFRIETLDGKIKNNRAKECAVAALAIGAEISYERAEEMVFRKDQDRFGLRIAKELGWRWLGAEQDEKLVLKDIPSGRIIVLFRNPWHFQAYINGVIVGPWDITKAKGKYQNIETWEVHGFFYKYK